MINEGEEIQKVLLEVADNFKKAEKALKCAETNASPNLILTPINQIRYSYSHLVNALSEYNNQDLDGFLENIRKANRHCSRAYYDAKDAEILYYCTVFDSFVMEAHEKGVHLTKILPNKYSEWCNTRARVKKFISEEAFDIPEKDDRYKIIGELSEKMQEVYEALPGAREAVNDDLSFKEKIQAEAKIAEAQLAEAREISRQQTEFARKQTKIAWWAVLVAIGSLAWTIFGDSIKEPAKDAPSLKQNHIAK